MDWYVLVSTCSVAYSKITFIFFKVMDLSDTVFYPDQLIKLTQMRILMGVHGSGMSNMIWMAPEKGGVVEVMVSGVHN
jgi:hypothetical protein